jgi:hypothetical protein
VSSRQNDYLENMDSIDIFKETKECIYKGEHYSVRDNGAVMRHAREGKRIRKFNLWTDT